MAKTFLALQLSEQKIRYLFFEKKGKELALNRTGVSLFKVDTTLPGALAQFIKEIISQSNTKPSRIFLTINRQDTVIHQLNLPQTGQNDFEVILQGEIEKIPSLAEQNFEYVYQKYQFDRNKTKVIFAAVANDLIKYLLAEIQQTGIPCREIEVSPLNFVGLLSKDEFKDGVQSLIVLEDRFTYFVLFQDRKIRYFYTTNIGIENIFPAELKGRIDMPSYIGWTEEIKRVLKSNLLENKREVVSKIWLLCDQERAGSFDEHLRKDMKWNIEAINIEKLPNIKLGDLEACNSIYLLGCVPAVCFLNKINPQYSLAHFFKSSQFKRYVSQILSGAVVFAAIVSLVFGGIIYKYSQSKQNAIKKSIITEEKIRELESQSQELFKVRDEYIAIRSQLLAQATYVKLLNRLSWSEVLSVVSTELPEELSLKTFKVNESGIAVFTGEAFRMEAIAEMLRKVDTSSILEQGKFSYLTEQEVNKQKIFSFGIQANIKLSQDNE